jgi:urea carboxylase
VTTKYNPARTWTAENSVGIGGSYLCVYGMEGPGGYQFIGRTLQMWNRYKTTQEFSLPWLLRFFDQIRFYEVSHEELQQIRRDFPQGRYPLTIEETEFSLAEYSQFLEQNQASITEFVEHRNQAFDNELAHWHATGQFNFEQDDSELPAQTTTEWPEHYEIIESPVPGNIWKLLTSENATVNSGDALLILESMKMEIAIDAPCNGIIKHVLSPTDTQVNSGQALIVMEPLS